MISTNIINFVRRLLGREALRDITRTLPAFTLPTLDPRLLAGGFHVVLLSDVSGSMSASDIHPNRLAAAQQAMRRLCQTLAEKEASVKISLVTFGDNARMYANSVPAGRLAVLTSAIDGVKLEGATNMQAGLELIVPLVSCGTSVNHVVVLSDGGSNMGDPEPTANILKTCATVQCVGIGQRGEVDEALLRRIASRDAAGRPLYTWIGDDADALAKHYAQTARDIVRKV
jgi:hypothetical protein